MSLDPCRPGSDGSPSDGPVNFVQSLQPVLAFEALLRPTGDVEDIAHRLCVLAAAHGINFSELVHQVIR